MYVCVCVCVSQCGITGDNKQTHVGFFLSIIILLVDIYTTLMTYRGVQNHRPSFTCLCLMIERMRTIGCVELPQSDTDNLLILKAGSVS